MPEVSIIVPVYNKGQYLQECIDSICKQSYQNFELILIDDGSTDNSGNICDKAADSDNRIIVFHTENKGVGAARNLGINKAKGEYIMFVDADDMLDCRCLQIMVDNMEPEIDIVYSGICAIHENKKEKILLAKNGTYSVNEFFKELSNYNIQFYYFGPIAKLIRNKFNKLDIRFEKQENIGEDIIFNMSLLCKVKKIKFIAEDLYYFRADSENSLSKSKYNSKYFCQRYMKIYRKTIKTISYVGNIDEHKKYIQCLRNKLVKMMVRNVVFDDEIVGIKNKIKYLKILRKKFVDYDFLDIQNEIEIKQKIVIILLKYKQYLLIYLFLRVNFKVYTIIKNIKKE